MTLKLVHDTPSTQDASIYKIWEYNKEYDLYMIILESRSEVKVTVTQKWYVTLHNPKIHPQTDFWILNSNNIGYTPELIADSRNKVRGQGHRDPRMVCDTPSSQDQTRQNFGFLPQII